MGLISKLQGKKVFLDSAPLIYFVERVSPYIDVVRPVFQAIQSGKIEAVTSSLTLAEVLVIPYRHKNEALANCFEKLLTRTPGLAILPLTLEIARETARIRAEFSFKTPDAIQWGTALGHKIDCFLTNDHGFRKLGNEKIFFLDDYC